MYNKIYLKLAAAIICGISSIVYAAPQQTLTSVRVENVTELTQSEPKIYVGTVKASETIDIVARISGVLWDVSFQEGSLVKEGDLLFSIEDTIYRENVNVAKALLKQAEAELTYAQKEKSRYETLYESQVSAQTTYESTVRTYDLYTGKRDEAQANLVLAENDLSYTKIYSPINGKIGENIYSKGNYITPEKGTLVTIVQYDPIQIKFSMSEADFFKYSNNGTLPVNGLEIYRADGKPYEGTIKVKFIDNQVDTQTGTLQIELEAENPDLELLPGGYVTVRFSEIFDTPLPAVSVTALMTDGKEHYVYVVNTDQRVERRKVTIGAKVRDKQIIVSGLQKGETVIVGGLNKTAPGEQVNPIYTVQAE